MEMFDTSGCKDSGDGGTSQVPAGAEAFFAQVAALHEERARGDWLSYWASLIREDCQYFGEAEGGFRSASGRQRAQSFDARVSKRWERPDPLRVAVLAKLQSQHSVLDIGAGPGAWVRLMAPRVRLVTAIEPSPHMAALLLSHIEAEKLGNVRLVEGLWPQARVPDHDVVLAAHSLYGCEDLASFVWAMDETASGLCCLIVRAPDIDPVLEEAARAVFGAMVVQADVFVAIRALAQMGIGAEVVMEPPLCREDRSYDSLGDALRDLRQNLRLGGQGLKGGRRILVDEGKVDATLSSILERHLERQDGRLLWPRWSSSGLLSWRPESRRGQPQA